VKKDDGECDGERDERLNGASESIPIHPHTLSHILSSLQPSHISYNLSVREISSCTSGLISNSPSGLVTHPKTPERIAADHNAGGVIGSEEMGAQRRGGVLFKKWVGMIEECLDERLRKEGSSFKLLSIHTPSYPVCSLQLIA